MSPYKTELIPNQSRSKEFGKGLVLDMIQTDQLISGQLTLSPHSTAGFDAGHDGVDEVFFVHKGNAVIEFPSLNESQVVHTGNYIMMPRGVPHVVHNREEVELTLIYFQVVRNNREQTEKE